MANFISFSVEVFIEVTLRYLSKNAFLTELFKEAPVHGIRKRRKLSIVIEDRVTDVLIYLFTHSYFLFRIKRLFHDKIHQFLVKKIVEVEAFFKVFPILFKLVLLHVVYLSLVIQICHETFDPVKSRLHQS